MINRLLDFIKLDRPIALSLEDWDTWKTKIKIEHPVKWFFNETLTDVYDKYIRYPFIHKIIDGIYWPIKYRIIPKHQYHIIKPSTLKPDYHNYFDLMIHSCFHILVEFVKNEKEEEIVDWEADESHSNFWKEANDLIDWWQNIRPFREEKLYEDYPFVEGKKDWPSMWMFYDKYKYSNEYIEYNKIVKIHHDAEIEFENQDEENLIRLMKIRLFLWT